jgi:GMP synthase (glutamine-hydrolysing)
MVYDTILILNFGGQYCHLIARQIRQFNERSEIIPYNTDSRKIRSFDSDHKVKGIVLSGGPDSVYRKGALVCDNKILEIGIPVLGICYGHQLIANVKGGKVLPGKRGEYGITTVNIEKPIKILKGFEEPQEVWMSHGDTVKSLPDGFEILASSKDCPVAAFMDKEGKIFGLQWHPEVAHTRNGEQMLRNFVFEVCKCKPNWVMSDFVEQAIREIKETVGASRCIIALSGGVDSSTATLLAQQAIGKNLTAVYVDHGFMRLNETESVKKFFSRLEMDFLVTDCKERFLKKLGDLEDPEEKRIAIGEEFVHVFEEIAKDKEAEFLIQGTIYPDRIESGQEGQADRIKSHHNVAGMPTRIKFKKVIEPLRELYKDEVRQVAERLRLPREIVWRQPFPGPGLAVRIMGRVTQDKIDVIRNADRIVAEEIENSGVDRRLWQYFAVLLDTMTTGVKGDSRAYGHVIAVRAVESREAMTASFARIPFDILERISTRITNELPKVVRVVYDITHKPPSTIEWE